MAKRTADRNQPLINRVSTARRIYHEKTLAYCVLLNGLDVTDFYEACIALVYTRFSFYHQVS
jgi:hypothetical protein